jgi:hypothetical protein
MKSQNISTRFAQIVGSKPFTPTWLPDGYCRTLEEHIILHHVFPIAEYLIALRRLNSRKPFYAISRQNPILNQASVFHQNNNIILYSSCP